jgi:hypothetical protein
LWWLAPRFNSESSGCGNPRLPLGLNAPLVSKFPLSDSLLALGECDNREDYGYYQS